MSDTLLTKLGLCLVMQQPESREIPAKWGKLTRRIDCRCVKINKAEFLSRVNRTG